jgi:hypothetical protein
MLRVRTLRSAGSTRPLSSRREPRRAGKVLDGRLPASRLRIELKQRAVLGADSDLDRMPERFEVSRQQGRSCVQVPLESRDETSLARSALIRRSRSRPRRPSTWGIAFPRHVSKNERLVLVVTRIVERGKDRGSRVLAELRIDWAERR